LLADDLQPFDKWRDLASSPFSSFISYPKTNILKNMSKFEEDQLPSLLTFTAKEAIAYLQELDSLPVAARLSLTELRAALQKELNDDRIPAQKVLTELIADTKGGLNNSTGGRFFGWVIGGNLPASLAADWMTSTWDQNAALYAVSPAAAVVEETVGAWVKDLLHLPSDASFAIVSGCQMAHVTALATARHELLSRRGFDVEHEGLYNAPPIRILCNKFKHGSIDRAVRFLGMGSRHIQAIESNPETAQVLVEGLVKAFEEDPHTPTIVVLQAGDISTGSFDDYEALIPVAHRYNAWVHIDGAFGLWAAASEKFSHLTKGLALADSWATDGHKWMNVAFDCGFLFTASPASHRATVSHRAVYLTHVESARDQIDWNPDWSRRSRGFAAYAAIRSLGRRGVAEMVEQCCDCCRLLVEGIAEVPGAEVVFRPLINQGMVRFLAPDAQGQEDHDAFTELVIQEICATGEAFFSPSVWAGRKVMRVSVCNYRTDVAEVQRVLRAVAETVRRLTEARRGL
jgi:glutamate/tyrosine decarboxylase-like PLP-dependent enzyme